MKVQTINILTNNSMAKNNKNDSEEDESLYSIFADIVAT